MSIDTTNKTTRSLFFVFHRAMLALVVLLSIFSVLPFGGGNIISMAEAATCSGFPGPLEINTAHNITNVTEAEGNAYLQCQIQNIYNIGFYVAVGLATIMVIIGGIRYTTAGGNSSEAGEAKTMIKEALIGLGIALLAAAFTRFLQS